MGQISIRSAKPSDAAAVRRVAERDSRRVPVGELLVAEADGHVRAALSLLSQDVIADPFHPTAALVDLLRMRERQVERPRQGTKRPWTAKRVLSPALAGPPGSADKLGSGPPPRFPWTKKHSPSA